MTTSLLMSKIIDISAARRRRENNQEDFGMRPDEQRSEIRHACSDRIFVQIVASPDRELVGTTLSCTARDVSATGICFESDTVLPEGCQLDLWVDNSSGPGKFFLSSTVRWSGLIDGTHVTGVELHDGAATDIDLWRARYPAL